MGMDVVEIVMVLEDHYGIRISDEEANQRITAGGLRDCVLGCLARQRPEVRVDERAVWDFVAATLSEYSGEKKDRTTPEMELVRDLGLG